MKNFQVVSLNRLSLIEWAFKSIIVWQMNNVNWRFVGEFSCRFCQHFYHSQEGDDDDDENDH